MFCGEEVRVGPHILSGVGGLGRTKHARKGRRTATDLGLLGSRRPGWGGCPGHGWGGCPGCCLPPPWKGQDVGFRDEE